MQHLSRYAPLLSLIVIALLIGWVWRLEVDYHGWHGLRWIGYFHWAVPFGLLLFWLWCGWVCGIRPLRKRMLFMLVLAVYACAAYYLCMNLLYMWFRPGPIMMLSMFNLQDALGAENLSPEAFGILLVIAILGAWFLIPFCFVLLVRAFGKPIGKLKATFSTLLFFFATPLATILLHAVPQPGSPDEIHAFKTGFVYPFFVFALGSVFLENPLRSAEAPTV